MAVKTCLKPPMSIISASGSICTFNALQEGLPLKSHKVALTATQSGSGTPSPSNPRAISGYDKIHVCGTGINLWGGAVLVTGIKTSIPSATEGTDYIEFASNAAASGYFTEGVKFKENTQYTFLFTLQNPTAVRSNLRIIYTDGTSSNVGNVTDNTKQTLVMVTDANKTIRGLEKRNAGGETRLFYDECALLEGVKTFDDFVPYNGHYFTIQIGSTVYGGTFDAITGILTVTHELKTIDENSGVAMSATTSIFYLENFFNIDNDEESVVCNCYIRGINRRNTAQVANNEDYSFCCQNQTLLKRLMIKDTRFITIEDYNSWLETNPVKIAVKLATPETIQLSPAQILTLKNNNVWADTGATSLQYIKIGR